MKFRNKSRALLLLQKKTRTNNMGVEESGEINGGDLYSQGHLSFALWPDMNE